MSKGKRIMSRRLLLVRMSVDRATATWSRTAIDGVEWRCIRCSHRLLTVPDADIERMARPEQEIPALIGAVQHDCFVQLQDFMRARNMPCAVCKAGASHDGCSVRAVAEDAARAEGWPVDRWKREEREARQIDGMVYDAVRRGVR